MPHYSTRPAGPETYESGANKGKTATTRIIVPRVNAQDYPQFSTEVKKVKGENKQVVVLEVPSAALQTPHFPSWDAFVAEAQERNVSPESKALEAVNAILDRDTQRTRRAVGGDAQMIPADPTEMFADVPERAVKAFFEGVQRAESAKARLESAAEIAANVDMSNPDAVAAALVALRAKLGIA